MASWGSFRFRVALFTAGWLALAGADISHSLPFAIALVVFALHRGVVFRLFYNSEWYARERIPSATPFHLLVSAFLRHLSAGVLVSAFGNSVSRLFYNSEWYARERIPSATPFHLLVSAFLRHLSAGVLVSAFGNSVLVLMSAFLWHLSAGVPSVCS